VPGLTRLLPVSTRDTVASDTPARAATLSMVTLEGRGRSRPAGTEEVCDARYLAVGTPSTDSASPSPRSSRAATPRSVSAA